MTAKYHNHISTVHMGFIPRMGLGYDVHAFTQGDHIMLCGIKIPHTQGLDAHSDGDVALHAITDALYGASANGDIGHHFPPSDTTYKNMNSTVFLQHACDHIVDTGGYIGNIDITIVAESPQINPHCMAMRQHISTLLHIPLNAISIKATTSEQMGFVGRAEGIAVYAIATIFIHP